MTGIIYKSTGSWYTVKTPNGKFYECRIKGKFRIQGIKSTNPIAVGDVVEFDIETKNNTATGVIKRIEERKNYIVRKSVNVGGLFKVTKRKTWSTLEAMIWVCLDRFTDLRTM